MQTRAGVPVSWVMLVCFPHHEDPVSKETLYRLPSSDERGHSCRTTQDTPACSDTATMQSSKVGRDGCGDVSCSYRTHLIEPTIQTLRNRSPTFSLQGPFAVRQRHLSKARPVKPMLGQVDMACDLTIHALGLTLNCSTRLLCWQAPSWQLQKGPYRSLHPKGCNCQAGSWLTDIRSATAL